MIKQSACLLILLRHGLSAAEEHWTLTSRGLSIGPRKEHYKASTLTGVGNRVDWAWPEVIEIIKEG